MHSSDNWHVYERDERPRVFVMLTSIDGEFLDLSSQPRLSRPRLHKRTQASWIFNGDSILSSNQIVPRVSDGGRIDTGSRWHNGYAIMSCLIRSIPYVNFSLRYFDPPLWDELYFYSVVYLQLGSAQRD